MKTRIGILGAAALGLALLVAPAGAQPPYPQQYPGGQSFNPEVLDDLVSRIALYPDPLLAQVLAGASYTDQIEPAATWAWQHRNWSGDQLAHAIYDDRLPWAPAVIALLPFPDVLDMMAKDLNWTGQLGSAVLSQRADVMDAVQRMRRRALDSGYLRDGSQERVVVNGGVIEIQPVDPGYYYVPVYDPGVVFVRPMRGGFVGAGIRFGPRVFIGASFGAWGWGAPGFDWRAHNVVIDRRPWERTVVNRERYEHPYAAPPRERVQGPPVEHHQSDRDFRAPRERERGKDQHDREREHHER